MPIRPNRSLQLPFRDTWLWLLVALVSLTMGCDEFSVIELLTYAQGLASNVHVTCEVDFGSHSVGRAVGSINLSGL